MNKYKVRVISSGLGLWMVAGFCGDHGMTCFAWACVAVGCVLVAIALETME